jgi:outer membrane protein assembly factor BamB
MQCSVTWLTIPNDYRTHLARRAATVSLRRAALLVVFASASCGRADTDAPAQSSRGSTAVVVNRGTAYADRRVFFNTLDNHTIAVDARTGRELWKTKLGDVLIGPSFRPFYAADHVTNLGLGTWPPDQWRLGGGTVWGRTPR